MSEIMAKVEKTYQELAEELETLLSDLQEDGLDVDQAMSKYERGLEIIKQLEQYLQTAENKVTKLQRQSGADS